MRDSSKPTICVVIAARDASEYIGATLSSLIAQSVPVDQVVVYDDGSIDDTAEIAEQFVGKLPRLTVLRGGDSLGISAARNRANSASTCDYIAVLDADDLYGPDGLDQQPDGVRSDRQQPAKYRTQRFPGHP